MESYLTQTQAYKLLREHGYRGITIAMIKRAMEHELPCYHPNKRRYVSETVLFNIFDAEINTRSHG